MKKLISLITVLCVLTSAASHASLIFGLKDDFSLTQNPNGAWAYVLQGNPLTTSRADAQFEGWDDSGVWDGAVFRSIGPQDVIIHSASGGSGDILTGVTWTSPSDAIINISGIVWDAGHAVDRDSRWELRLNGDVIAERGSVFGVASTASEALLENNLTVGQSLTNITISTGDIVYLVTAKTTSFGHFLGADLSIEVIPEPGTISLIVIFGGLLMARCRDAGPARMKIHGL
jgi:hypothetical protein